MSELDAKEMNSALFMNLVMMLSTSAMQQLGKLVNPASGKTEVNLEAAQISIDMLSMLQEKTRGNLDRDEERLLGNALATAQMNFVEVSRETPAEKPAAAAAAETPAPEAEPAADAEAPRKDAKFHKSYGA